MFKLSFIILVLIVILLFIFIIIKRKNKKYKIANTDAVIVSIKKISEFVTICFFEEKIIIERKPKKYINNKLGDYITKNIQKENDFIYDEVCLIAKGEVRAGYNLKNIKNIRLDNNILELELPKPEIFDVIINPKGWDFYVEEGNWSEEEINEIKSKVKEEIKQDAINIKILEQAEQGKEKLKILLMSFGFKHVNFI